MKRGRQEPRIPVIGVMSGTSLDGIDAVLASFQGEPPRVSWKLRAHHAVPFDPALRKRLRAVAEGEAIPAREFAALHFALGEVYAAAVLELMHEAGVEAGEVAAVGLSGQTVYHQSARASRAGGVTLQLGAAAIVAERTRIRAVSDLRAADVAAGGEGAPLVPYADWLLFRAEDEGRVILNLGGIANLTAIPAGAAADGLIAFDTGPGNMGIDAVVERISEGADSYDLDGERAARGRVDHELVEEFLADPFFSQEPPRSTGRERFGRAWADRWMWRGRERGLGDDDLVASVTALTAESVARAVRSFVLPRGEFAALYAAGGGAENPTLLEMLAERLEPMSVDTTLALGVPVACREALAFAALTYETLAGRPGNLPAATGAARRVVLGQLTGEPGRSVE